MIYLLDTNILIHDMNKNPLIKQRRSALPGGDHLIGTTFVSVRELYWGAYRSQRVKENLARLQKTLDRCLIYPCTMESSRLYGRLRSDFSRHGIAFHDPDLVIASIALAEGATVVSDDQVFIRHPIDGLTVDNWLA